MAFVEAVADRTDRRPHPSLVATSAKGEVKRRESGELLTEVARSYNVSAATI